MFAKAIIERQPIIQQGKLIIDPQCCSVKLDGKEVELYPKEFDVLLFLAQYPGWVLSTEQIYLTVWGEELLDSNHIVYNTICQIRKKLKRPEIIQTVINRGYKFVQ